MPVESVPKRSERWSVRLRSPSLTYRRIMFVLTVFIFLSTATICIINGIHWIGKPFPGFLWNARNVVADFGLFHWSGVRAGLHYPDKLISANGKSIVTGADLHGVIQGTRIGSDITYMFDRDGEQLEITLPTMRFTVWDLTMTFGIELLAALLFFSLGVTVFVMKPHTEVSW